MSKYKDSLNHRHGRKFLLSKNPDLTITDPVKLQAQIDDYKRHIDSLSKEELELYKAYLEAERRDRSRLMMDLDLHDNALPARYGKKAIKLMERIRGIDELRTEAQLASCLNEPCDLERLDGHTRNAFDGYLQLSDQSTSSYLFPWLCGYARSAFYRWTQHKSTITDVRLIQIQYTAKRMILDLDPIGIFNQQKITIHCPPELFYAVDFYSLSKKITHRICCFSMASQKLK